MKQYITLILLTILFSVPINAQNGTLKLIEKGQFSKAEKKINTDLVKTPDDIAANYSKAILFSQPAYKSYSLPKAYETLQKTKSLYNQLHDDKELKSLSKIPIDAIVLDATNDSICLFAIEDATNQNTIDGFQSFLNIYVSAPQEYKNRAIEKRDVLAFNDACKINTLLSYQSFIDQYPNAAQRFDAEARRNELAFLVAQQQDVIEGYQLFIQQYPKAIQVAEAQTRIHEIAFHEAERINTSTSYQAFCNAYPSSRQYTKAYQLYEKQLFHERTTYGNWWSYVYFIKQYPNNSYVGIALDSIYMIGTNTRDMWALKFCTDNYSGAKRNTALLGFHDLFTIDGERITLDIFYNEYDEDILADIKEKDYQLAALGDALNLNNAYLSKNRMQYDEYIRMAAPREKAFVALQRMISTDIATKNWQGAIGKINSYKDFFGATNKKMIGLLEILEAKWDSSIKINSIGNSVNSVAGGEYAPVISADDKLLFFCGRERKDNLGGEDIFYSQKYKGVWGNAKLLGLSSIFNNESPQCVSTDGTMIIFFSSGKLKYAEKDKNGWSYSYSLPTQINGGDWQSDANISSDGKAMLFSSTKPGGYNLHEKSSAYHGDSQYASDIYLSVLDDNGEWGEPINLGSVINTPFCERKPFLHPDMKTLYFSSDGHGGLGKLDVYKSTRLADTCWTCWSEPINMGKEINTEESDWGYKISTDGEKAYFSKSNSAKENEDIYWLNIPKHLRPDMVATITGRLVDKNNQPVYAEIRWEDLETGKNVGQSKSDPVDGSFFVVLPIGKIYGYYVDKDEYYSISNNIDLRKTNEPIHVDEDINMISFKQMIEDGTAVPVNNLFFNFSASSLLPYSLPELKRVASIIKSNHLKIEISGHTDNYGDDKQNQSLSEQRALSVKEFLVNEGCDADFMSVVGYGETHPVASNDTEAGRAKNRRVELRIMK